MIDRPARPAASLALAAALLPTAPAVADGPFLFTDPTAAAGIDFRGVCGAPPAEKGWLAESMGTGAAWLDYDGDGNLDLFLVNGSTFARAPGQGEPDRLFRGDGKGRFTDVTAAAGVGDRGWGYGVAVGDHDNDGDPDIYVTNNGPNTLYRNNGNGTFTDVTRQAGVGDPRFGTSAAFFDIEPDGDLDLYVANYMETDTSRVPRRGTREVPHCTFKGIDVFCGPLGQAPQADVLYRNDGDGTFTDVTREAGVGVEPPRYALGVVTGDYDNDGRQDVYVANDSVQNSLFRNLGGGRFSDVGVVTLCGLDGDGRAQAGMGTDLGDFDGDGWLDIVVTNFSHDLNTVYRSSQGRFFVDDSQEVGMSPTYLALSWGTAFRDFDRDGDVDLFIANGHVYPQVDDYDLGTTYRQRNHLFANEGGKRFVLVASGGAGLEVERSFRGAAFGDYDNDGDVDVALTALDEAALLLRNDSPVSGHYLQVTLVGTTSNRDGVGARVRLEAGGRTQIRERTGGGSYLSASDPRLHFGLGAAQQVRRLEVRWPSGKVDVLTDLAADRSITIREGSSPAPASPTAPRKP